MTLNKKRSLGLIALVVLVMVVSFTVFQLNNKKVDGSQVDNPVKLKFGDNFISYILEEEGMQFNMFAVQNVKDKNVSLADIVTSVDFDNPNIEIVDYQIDEGIVHRNHKLTNILVTVKVLGDEVEKANKLVINYKDMNSETYHFGDITVQNRLSYNDDHLEPSGKYNVGYPTPALDVNVKNAAQQAITPLEINDLTGNFSYQIESTYTIDPKQVKHIDIEQIDINREKTPDFTTITPILTYDLGGNEYMYDMPGVIYGILDADVDKINKMID